MPTAFTLLLIIMSLTTLPVFAESKEESGEKPLSADKPAGSDNPVNPTKSKVLRGKIKYAGVRDAMKKADKRPKPDWIEGEVYTHSGMYVFGRSYRNKTPNKLRNFRIPKDKISSRVTLDQSVTKFWNGYVPPGKCYVTFIPIKTDDGKEHFKFIHADPHGPFGYMEYIDTVKAPQALEGKADKNGHAMYKCWFGVDQNPEGADVPSQVTADGQLTNSQSTDSEASPDTITAEKKPQVSANPVESSQGKSQGPK